jgi:hypothetical protein
LRLAAACLSLSAAAVLIGGCAAHREAAATTTPPGLGGEGHAMQIELLGFPGCPNTPAMRANLTAALKNLGGGLTFTDTNQEALPEHDLRRGWPTPTVLVSGADLFGMAPPTAPSMGCRMYPGGVPDPATIAVRLRALAAAK